MRIVHVILSLKIGGAERMAVDLALAQVQRGHRVSMVILTPEPDPAFASRLSDARVQCSVVPKKEGIDPSLVPRIALALARWRAQVVHTHNRVPLIYGAVAGRMVGAKVIHTRHGGGLGSSAEGRLRQVAGALVHAYVGVTPATSAVARDAGDTDPHKIHTVENGVDVERFAFDPHGRAKLRQELQIPPDAWTFGSVGRLVPEKDYGLLLASAGPLLGEKCRLLMVGDGTERGALQRQATELGIDKWVHFVGARPDIADYLSVMDAFVLSSRTEGLPIALLEAMSNERPVLSTAVGGIPSVIVHGKTGLLVPAGDKEKLRESLLALRNQPDKAADMGRAARAETERRYGLDRMAEAYLDLYRQVGAPS